MLPVHGEGPDLPETGRDGSGVLSNPLVSRALAKAAAEYDKDGVRNFAYNASVQEAECYIDREAGPHGGVDKGALGLQEHEKVRIGAFEPMCNPISQAEVLNAADKTNRT